MENAWQNENPEILITLDVDWAPEPAIEMSIDLLNRYGIRATFFATHDSEILRQAQRDELIEIGLHPNYFKNKNFEFVIDELLELYPNSKAVKAHGLYSSANIMKLYQDRGFHTCGDIFLPNGSNLKPLRRFGPDSLLMIPYNWEDANYFTYESKIDFKPDRYLTVRGLKVFNFHPIHVFANTRSPSHYQDIKKHYHNPRELEKLRASVGSKNFFENLLVHCQLTNALCPTFSEVHNYLEQKKM